MTEHGPRVFVPNKSGHDFSSASEFGEIVFLTTGRVNRHAANTIYQEVAEMMENVNDTDHIIVSSLNIITMMAAAIMARKTGFLNLLVFSGDHYSPHRICIDNLLGESLNHD